MAGPGRHVGSARVPLALLLAVVLGCQSTSPSSGPPGTGVPSTTGSTAPGTTSPTTGAAVEHRIGVRTVDGDGEFFDRQTGDRWVPRGANLVRLDSYHDLFNPGHYDGPGLDGALARMAELGYNAVRVFHDQRQGGLTADASGSLSAAYLDNVADFLARAKARGIQVMFTQDWLPDGPTYAQPPSPGIDGINTAYLSVDAVAANARFFRDFVDGLIARGAAMDAAWGFEVRNELYFDAHSQPFSLTSGSVTAANGLAYDMADPAQRRAIAADGTVHFVDTVRAEILGHDPTALVGVGFFVPKGPNPARPGDDRIVESAATIAGSTADFVDIHGYPKADLPLAQHLENFGLTGPVARPILMGEMGAFRNLMDAATGAKALVSWQADSCAFGFDGWLVWTWDSVGGYVETWNSTDEGELIATTLAPSTRPDPCDATGGQPLNLALGRPTLTSHALASDPGSQAVDGILETTWNAGGGPTQWIRIDLGKAAPAGAMIRLVVAQSPSGHTRTRLLGGATAGSLALLHVFDRTTTDGDNLTFALTSSMTHVRYLRVETVASPSWVSWREIEVLAGG